jgi:hypothetical protein
MVTIQYALLDATFLKNLDSSGPFSASIVRLMCNELYYDKTTETMK